MITVPPLPPNGICNLSSLIDAIAAGYWSAPDPSYALWLNTAFPVANHTTDSLQALLEAHGIMVNEDL